jgi:hypothetical protein
MSSNEKPYPIDDAALAFFGAKERALIVDGDNVVKAVKDKDEKKRAAARVAELRARYEARKVELEKEKA